MKIIAIDPGTHITGYAIFLERDLKTELPKNRAWDLYSFGSIKPPKGAELEDRIRFIIDSVNQLIPVDAVVCEAQPTMKGRVSPELAVLIRRFRRWATHSLKVPWKPINTSTVTATMRRHIGNPAPGIKRSPAETRAQGIAKLYGVNAPEAVGQDVIDAVAVGRTYLEKSHL